jgi:hypothetical protein
VNENALGSCAGADMFWLDACPGGLVCGITPCQKTRLGAQGVAKPSAVFAEDAAPADPTCRTEYVSTLMYWQLFVAYASVIK